MIYKQTQIADTRSPDRLARLAFGLLSLLPLLLVFSRSLADGAGSIIGALFLLRCCQTSDWSWLKEPVLRVMLALWLYLLLIVTPLAIEPVASLAQAGPWIRYMLFFAAMIHWLPHYPQALKRAFCFTAILLLFIAADALVQYLTGSSLAGHVPIPSRLSGPFTHVVVGIFLAKLTFPIVGLWLYEACRLRNRNMIVGGTAFLLIMLGFIVLSNERTALITFACGLLIVAALLSSLKTALKPVLCACLALIAIAGGIYLTQPRVALRVQQSVQELPHFSQSPYGQLWIASLDIWQQHPVTGVGLMNFRDECPKLQQAGSVNYCDQHSHNPYLQMLSETGFFGFIIFIALAVSLARMLLRDRPRTPEGMLIAAFALATLMPTFFPLAATQSFFSNWPAWLAWLSIGLAAAMVRSTRYE